MLTRINGFRFRTIDIQITATCADGSAVGDRHRIITTLLDHHTDPAVQIARLYHARWEIESAFFALRHNMFHGRVLRSTDPVGLEQEMWAALTIYQRLRRALCDAVETAPGTDPDRASFTVALTAAINQIVTATKHHRQRLTCKCNHQSGFGQSSTCPSSAHQRSQGQMPHVPVRDRAHRQPTHEEPSRNLSNPVRQVRLPVLCRHSPSEAG